MYDTSTTTASVLLIIGYLTLSTTYTTGVSASEDAIIKTERANLIPAQRNRSAVIEFKAANGKPLTPAEYRAVRLAILRALNHREHKRRLGVATQEITTVPTSTEAVTDNILDLEPARRRRNAFMDEPIPEYYNEDALKFVNMDPAEKSEVFRKALNGTGEGTDEITFDELVAAIKEAHDNGELEEAAGGKPVVIYYKLGDLDPLLKLWITIPLCLLLLLLLLLLLICCSRRRKNRRQKLSTGGPDEVVNKIPPYSAPPTEYPVVLPSRSGVIRDSGSFP